MKRLSIQFKVTFWFTLLMVILGCVSLGFLFFAGGRSAQQETRALMMNMVSAGVRQLDVDDGRLDIDDDLEYFREGVYLSLYDTAGVPLYGAVPREFDNSAVFDDGNMRTLAGNGQNWYVYDVLVTVPGWGGVWLRSVSAASQVDTTLNSLYRLALVVLPFFVALSAVGGYLLTKRAFRPVRHITRTARRIGRSEDLSQRINLGPGQDEIHTLAAAFDEMFARLQDAFEREKQFTSDASHELRTPTAVILSQCEDALDSARTLDEAKAALQTIHGQAEKMAALLSQLLMLARADQGQKKLRLETVDLSGLAGVVAEQMEESAHTRNITLDVQIEPGLEVQGDETMLMRLLINLLENAIKYGSPGGWAKLELSAGADGKTVCGCVSDNGIGIAPDQLPQVWKRFWQADPARSGGGAGLGLSMVQWIAQAHGGTVRVESRQAEGSAFFFELPVNGPACEAKGEGQQTAAPKRV